MTQKQYLYTGINPVLNKILDDFDEKKIPYKLHKPNKEMFVNGFYSKFSPTEIKPYVTKLLDEMGLRKIICISPEDIKEKQIANIQMKNRAGLCVLESNRENRLKIYETKKL